MGASIVAHETVGTLAAPDRLMLDEPVPANGSHRVRVLILYPPKESEAEWYAAAATNPAFDFLKDPAEDVYSADDGTPFHA